MEIDDDLDTEIKVSDKALNQNPGGMLKNLNKPEAQNLIGNYNRLPTTSQNMPGGPTGLNQPSKNMLFQGQNIGVQNLPNLQNKPSEGGFPGTTVKSRQLDSSRSSQNSNSEIFVKNQSDSFSGNMSQGINSNPQQANPNIQLNPPNLIQSGPGLNPDKFQAGSNHKPIPNMAPSVEPKRSFDGNFGNAPLNNLIPQSNANEFPKFNPTSNIVPQISKNPPEGFKNFSKDSPEKFNQKPNPIENKPKDHLLNQGQNKEINQVNHPVQHIPMNGQDRMQKPNANPQIFSPNNPANIHSLPGPPINPLHNFNQSINIGPSLIKKESQDSLDFPKIGPASIRNERKGNQNHSEPEKIIHPIKTPKPEIPSVQAHQNFKPTGVNIGPATQPIQIISDNKANQHIPHLNPEIKNMGSVIIGKQMNPNRNQNVKKLPIEKSISEVPIRLNKEIPKNHISIRVVKMIPEDTLRYQINLINILSTLIDYNELIKNYNEFSKYLSYNFSKGSGECEKLLKFINERLSCELCHNNNMNSLIELKCKTIICTDCLFNAGEISIQKNFFGCPKCRKVIDEDEQVLIWQKLGKSQEEVERDKLELKYKNEGQVICIRCDKYKKNFYHGCLHVCKECFAADLRNNYISCQKCYEIMNIDAILNETFECKSCEQITYFVGSYGKYVHNEALALCIVCVLNFFNQGVDRVLKIKLSKSEKIEINDHLFQRCEGCDYEIFREYLEIQNCGHVNCHTCIENKTCNGCIRLNSS